jgi:hypothetical protein
MSWDLVCLAGGGAGARDQQQHRQARLDRRRAAVARRAEGRAAPQLDRGQRRLPRKARRFIYAYSRPPCRGMGGPPKPSTPEAATLYACMDGRRHRLPRRRCGARVLHGGEAVPRARVRRDVVPQVEGAGLHQARALPLTPVPTYARSHLRPFPLRYTAQDFLTRVRSTY